MSRGTPAGPNLVKDLQGQLKKVTTDLRERSEQPDDAWAQQLRAEYDAARHRGRTALTWTEWRDGEIDLAAVAWILATVFIRFCEDNQLINGPWITGQGARHAQAADNETAFYQQDPTRNSRDWLLAGFQALADLPAGRDLLDPRHNLVWRAPISADAASALLTFWRTQDAEGNLIHDFTDPDLDTRFLGDLYQDLSDHAKKKYALLQTPVFVEEFILDRTLTPAIEDFGLDGLKLIDPTCGSGHFLLGAFQRLLRHWQAAAPAMDTRQRVQKALNSIHGVDLNPFAVAIARFRLTVAALQASGLKSLKDAPAFDYHLVVGDSLLYGHSGTQEDLLASDDDFTYASEDISSEPHILDRGRYHVVVGNPPYITVQDKALNEAYRKAYSTCHRQYALSVPFMELFFELAVKGSNSPAGYVGQITSNSFMKREFGVKLIQDLLSGDSLSNPVNLTEVIDTSGAYIPGHGTPTLLVIGRRQRPNGATVRVVLGRRGEPRAPVDPAKGLVWQELVGNVGNPGFSGRFVTVQDWPRERLRFSPWILNAGGYEAVARMGWTPGQEAIRPLKAICQSIGDTGRTSADEVFIAPRMTFVRNGVERELHRSLVEGSQVRDFCLLPGDDVFFPYSNDGLLPIEPFPGAHRRMWPFRTTAWARATFSKKTYREEGRSWWEWHQVSLGRLANPISLAFAEVATHNHVVLDGAGALFKQTAPAIKLPSNATEDDHWNLLGLLNSSAVCFWLKQVCHNKGDSTDTEGARVTGDPAFDTFQFNSSNWEELPLPSGLSLNHSRRLHFAARQVVDVLRLDRDPETRLTEQILKAASSEATRLRETMIFLQEEIDWEVYRAYGLIDEDLTYTGVAVERLRLGERAFEIALARKIAQESEETEWFVRHGSTPITELPESWPADYRVLVERRLEVMAADPSVGLLERPEYKRRWQSATFDELLPSALRRLILDRIEGAELWSDASGPGVLSVAQLADRLRTEADLVEAVQLFRGALDVDLTAELSELLADEAVPFLAAYRYKESGLRKREEWERVWDLQRREDVGEQVSIPVPPKYGSGDFRKTSYWNARGKLDAPKERFISYPGATRSGDPTMVVGWAGWDHLEQARALARLIVERSTNDDLSPDAHLSLVAGLVELEPWLHQWHGDPDPAFGGTSPATFMTGFIDNQLTTVGKTRADAKAWRL